MRVLHLLIIVVGLAAALPACKDKSDKPLEDGKVETAAEAQEVANAVQQSQEEANDRWASRKAKGDTVAMPYKDLQAYLPEISGYTKDGEPKGSQVAMPGMGSWSNTEQRYTNGDKSIDVQIADYNSAYTAFAGVTAVYKMGFSAEDDQKKQGATDLGLKDVAAYETIYKDGSKAELNLIVADRFFINIVSNGDNSSDVVRSVAKNMKLDDLATK